MFSSNELQLVAFTDFARISAPHKSSPTPLRDISMDLVVEVW